MSTPCRRAGLRFACTALLSFGCKVPGPSGSKADAAAVDDTGGPRASTAADAATSQPSPQESPPAVALSVDAAGSGVFVLRGALREEPSCSYMPAAKNFGTEVAGCEWFPRPPGLTLDPPPPPGRKIHDVLSFAPGARPSVVTPSVGGCRAQLKLLAQSDRDPSEGFCALVKIRHFFG